MVGGLYNLYSPIRTVSGLLFPLLMESGFKPEVLAPAPTTDNATVTAAEDVN